MPPPVPVLEELVDPELEALDVELDPFDDDVALALLLDCPPPALLEVAPPAPPAPLSPQPAAMAKQSVERTETAARFREVKRMAITLLRSSLGPT
jgi:hypothetical protein